uniref:Reverse transcriptase domain-containing protein n=1 Tax=Chromera velia CCMP2878 TaxID=1169474 RepID=A0A0G4ID56_9ALVE|eukprot:Cvel_2296.t1-p1 / transcript=Cvel_2296.t1 / gene=Cvel_2296 / organism=Chromera_velia_CCMP2878 / gene_product=Transposon Ty3-I Gag-Pol polyprotein, putative / transcript_product=Transposon Ty3-I Gag-Pol polyprotein, putative / location=Cvel_scaffold89:3593-5572(+) / protein_length=660 / sequence_SO=supercontig / SO=protein_coding / is_pseudo=false
MRPARLEAEEDEYEDKYWGDEDEERERDVDLRDDARRHGESPVRATGEREDDAWVTHGRRPNVLHCNRVHSFPQRLPESRNGEAHETHHLRSTAAPLQREPLRESDGPQRPPGTQLPWSVDPVASVPFKNEYAAPTSFPSVPLQQIRTMNSTAAQKGPAGRREQRLSRCPGDGRRRPVLMRLRGMVNGTPVMILFDPGAAPSHGLPVRRFGRPTDCEGALAGDPSHQVSEYVPADGCRLKIDEYEDQVSFTLTDLKKYDLFLGMRWCEDRDPVFRPKMKKLWFDFEGKRILLRGDTTPEKKSSRIDGPMTVREATREVRKGAPFFLCRLERIEREEEEKEVERERREEVGEVEIDPRTKEGIQERKPPFCEYEKVMASPSLHSAAREILKENKELFPDEIPKLPLRRGDLDFKIELEPGARPPAKPPYRLSYAELEEMKKQLKDYVDRGFIHPSTSPFGAPAFFVKKKDGTFHMVIDYRPLNKVTVKDTFPLPRAEELMETLFGKRWFTKLDLRQFFHQLRIAMEDSYKTAFITRCGTFEWLVMPFGVSNAPPVSMRLITLAMRPALGGCVIVFINDILVYSRTLAQHVKDVKWVLDLLRANNLYVKIKKCEFFTNSTHFLGFVIDAKGIMPERLKLELIRDWPDPKDLHELRIFLRAAN